MLSTWPRIALAMTAGLCLPTGSSDEAASCISSAICRSKFLQERNSPLNLSLKGRLTAKERVLQCVLTAVEELNAGLPREKRLAKSPEVVLFGEQGALDSMGLATLVVLSEQRVEEEFGRPISVADERALSQHRSPFRTIETLADYITLLVEEA